MPTISIIIPIYNAENTLSRCIESVLNQSYKDYELLLIDDGSRDKSPDICDQYSKIDKRIVSIHKKNSGPASTRNDGIDMASGEYLLFLDSDDYVSPEWCEHMMKCVHREHNNFIFGGIIRENNKEKSSNITKPFISLTDGIAPENFIKYQIESLVGYPWNVLHYKDVLDKYSIRFPKNRLVEDLPFHLQYMLHLDMLTFTGHADNHYVLDNDSSVSRKYEKDAFRRWSEKYADTISFINEKFGGDALLKKMVSNEYVYHFLNSLNNTFDSRNHDNWFLKMKYNSAVVNSSVFQDCLKNADSSKENAKLITILKMKKYYLAFLYMKMASIKSDLRNKL